MAFISIFCFWCSVRLGSVLIGSVTLVQASFLLGITLVKTDSLFTITKLLNEINEVFRCEGDICRSIADNPTAIVIGFAVFFSCLVCSSLLLLYGCFQLNTYLMYPFLLFYLFYIFGLLASLLIILFYSKAKGRGLGDLILYSNLGGFIILFYFYTWACVVSLIQIINELKNRLNQKLKVLNTMKKTTDLKVYANKKKLKVSRNYAHFK